MALLGGNLGSRDPCGKSLSLSSESNSIADLREESLSLGSESDSVVDSRKAGKFLSLSQHGSVSESVIGLQIGGINFHHLTLP